MATPVSIGERIVRLSGQGLLTACTKGRSYEEARFPAKSRHRRSVHCGRVELRSERMG
jgi:hypothetical protein